MFERTETLGGNGDNECVRINDARLSIGQNIMRRGSSMRRGENVLAAGRRLRSIELGLLAEIGRTRVRATARPTVAVLATGNELVASNQMPNAGQIRNSNSPMLVGCVRELGATAIDLGIATDDVVELRTKVSAGLKADVMVVCGGVSAGLLDLVPQAFTDSGVVEILHKVAVKPGKPLWFGVLQDEGRERLVFGLPGNPVSSFVCFQLFVRPALAILAGRTDARLRLVTATLAIEQKQRGERETYLPARAEDRDDTSSVMPLDWRGSGDLAGLSRANALARFPAGERTFRAGEVIEVLLLD
jgi:molybdopterin molybdotransferase